MVPASGDSLEESGHAPMRRRSTTTYQFLTSAFILTVGAIVGIVAIRIWEEMIVSEAIEGRSAIVESLEFACSRADSDPHDCLLAAAARTDLGIRAAALVGPDGTVLASTADSPGEPRPAVLAALAARGPRAFRITEAGAGRPLVVVTPLLHPERPGESLVVTFDMAGVDAKVHRAIRHVLGLVGTLALVNFLCIGWLVRRWVNPIADLTRKMEDVQRGDLSVVVPEERTDEIGDLARHFNAMLVAIRNARKQSLEVVRRQANIEKFAALGRLSSGVVHEINNPVGGILTALAVLRDVEPGSKRYEEYLEMMRVGLERIASIVSQLLRFSRQSGTERKEIDLNRLLDEVTVLARLQHRAERMHVVRRYGEIPAIRGAPDLLSQLFVNLMMNAFQAMPDGGILTLTTRLEDNAAAIVLEDTGPGISEDVIERIFEPFFTTKEVGKGTGLGLSVALGIVEAHGGTLEAGNREDGGARFTIRLPLHPEEPGAVTAPAGRKG